MIYQESNTTHIPPPIYSWLNWNFLVLSAILFCIICCFEYQSTKLFYYPLREKLIILLAPWIIIICILWYLDIQKPFNLTLPLQKYPGAVLFLLIFTFLIMSVISFLKINQIPTSNTLLIEVKLDAPTQNNDNFLSILEIISSSPENHSDVIPNYKTSTSGSCLSIGNGIICRGADVGTVIFKDVSNNSFSILLEGSHSDGSVKISLNNESQIVDTKRATDDQFSVSMPYKFQWQNQSTMKKLEIIMVFFSNSVCIFIALLLVVTIIVNRINWFFNLSQNRNLFIIVLVLIFAIIINLKQFQYFQTTDIFKLQRVHGNTLIDLDNSSHDNIKNLPVYLNFYQYYKNHDLYITENQLIGFRLDSENLQRYSRAKSVNLITSNQELSQEDVDFLKDKKTVTILPGGRIRFTYKLILEPLEENTGICAWYFEDTTYFIPIQDQFECRKEIK
jgi:hypothetical protein